MFQKRPSFKESHEVFEAGDGSSLKQEDEPFEAEAKRFKSSHKVKEAVSPIPKHWTWENIQMKY